jgi:hypothetical protein
VSCVSSPFSLVREASRSAQPNETRGVRRDDPLGILDIADFVIDQRSVECLFRVSLRPSLSIDQGSIVGPVLPHELTFCALRLSSFVASARNSPLGPTKR